MTCVDADSTDRAPRAVLELRADIGLRVTVDASTLAEWRECGLIDAAGRVSGEDGFAWDLVSDALAYPPHPRSDLSGIEVEWLDVTAEDREVEGQ